MVFQAWAWDSWEEGKRFEFRSIAGDELIASAASRVAGEDGNPSLSSLIRRLPVVFVLAYKLIEHRTVVYSEQNVTSALDPVESALAR